MYYPWWVAADALRRGYELLVNGKLDEAEAELLRVARSGPAYEGACVLLAKAAEVRGEVPFRVDHYLSEFLRRSPSSQESAQAFVVLEKVYRGQGLVELADELRGQLFGDQTLPEAPAAPGSLPDLPSATLPPLPPLPDDQGAAAAKPITLDPSFLRPLTQPPAVDSEVGEWEDPTDQDVFTRSPPNRRDVKATRARTGGPASRVGQVLAGRYRIEGILGRGGMATVYSVTDLELDDTVALKLFASGQLRPEILERFKQELKVTRRLRHQNVVQLYDLGVEGDDYFITMELLQGLDLHQLRRRDGDPSLPPARVAKLLAGAARGLGAAHKLGVVHRDIKPGNIFVTEGDEVKVMDFGIARARLDDEGVQTRTGVVLGTPQYMAPEQAQDSSKVTALTDIYALGVVAFELSTGQRPFDEPGLVATMMAHVTKPPPRPRALNQAVPPALEKVILRCLEKKPSKRFPDAASLAAALDALARTSR